MDYALDVLYGDKTANTQSEITKAIKGGLIDDTVVYVKGSSEPVNFYQWAEENDLMSVTKEGDIKKLKDDGFEIVPENSGLITVANQSGQPMVAISIKMYRLQSLEDTLMIVDK